MPRSWNEAVFHQIIEPEIGAVILDIHADVFSGFISSFLGLVAFVAGSVTARRLELKGIFFVR
jgi:hypothetical protein